MRYVYYPGCSLDGSAHEYDVATRSVMRALGVDLVDLEDWTCCGASAAEPLSYLLSIALPARNLALAEGMQAGADLLVPCSACYLNLRKVEDHFARDEKLPGRINEILGEDGLRYKGGVKVRHLLDVIANDIGFEKITAGVVKALSGIRVAPYYGCQCLRPYRDFDDPERPMSMDAVITALGAEVHQWEMGAKCCGAGLMTTKKEVALELTSAILMGAWGADCIVTVCPMCQMNLEAFQRKISSLHGRDLSISVLYLPQLIGYALGLEDEELKISMNLAVTDSFKASLKA